jgi:hypothetical protein
MRVKIIPGARLIAGALLLFACRLAAQPAQPSPPAAGEATPPVSAAPPRLQLAAGLRDGICPSGPGALGIARLDAARVPPVDSSRCLVIVEVRDLSDAPLSEIASRLARSTKFGFVLLDFSGSDGAPERIPFAVKRLSSAVRAVSPDAKVGLDLGTRPAGEEDLSPYADALVFRAGAPAPAPMESGGDASIPGRWVLLPPSGKAASDVIRTLEALPRDSLASVSLAARVGEATDEEARRQLDRMQAYLTADVSPDPTPTAVSAGRENYQAIRFFHAKRFTPIVFVHESADAALSRMDTGDGSYVSASVENLATGARRDFDLKSAKSLVLDASKGDLAIVLQPASRPGRDSRTAVDVSAVRGLTADEIVARERAWETGQQEKVQSYVGQMKASLRFRVAEVNETFDLTILGPFFSKRGEPADWEWDEFYLNGVKWKGKTLPSLPILQPEKVTTLPLEIRLSEEYTYELHGEATVNGRRAYHVSFNPKSSVGSKPVYRGSVWIDKETFALLRRDSVQLNLKGETLSNIQTEYYRPVSGHPDVLLPLEIKGQQVFSTAGRTTAIERDVILQNPEINSPEFETRRAAAWASPAQMIRDTDVGMRYLIPDPAAPGARIVQTTVSRKSTFGILGAFYDKSLDYPIPLIGLQHFNFDLFGKGKQLSVFFGGALLTTNYTDPGIGGSRFDLGLDLFGAAVAFGDVSYRNGREVTGQKIKHLPAIGQLNIGHPLGPYLKTSLGIFAKYDNYQRDKDTAAAFITPVDTITTGVDLKLIANVAGFNATVSGSYFNRNKWELWGDPNDLEYKPSQKDYFRWEASISKDQYFSGFRKLHFKLGYLDGTDLDRFSKYEFGSFSSHPMHGFQSGSLRTQTAWVANLSYGINIEDIIRFEGFYDQAVLTDKISGFHDTYFSGAGLLASLNGPWKNSLFRAELGVPVVRHGVTGFVVNLLVLKLF